MKTRFVRCAVPLLVVGLLLSACAPPGSGIDETLSLDESKDRAQDIEREIVSVLPVEIVADVDQMKEGSFLACSRDGGDQWAGGLTATVVGDPSPEQVIGPIAMHFTDRDDVAVRLREEDGDSLVDIIGTHESMWIVRYIRDRAELDVDSFAACIRLPDDVWRGGTY